MNLFRSYTFTWWQVGIFKLALLAIGIIIGTYLHEFMRDNIAMLVVVAATATAYIIYIALRQQKDHKSGQKVS